MTCSEQQQSMQMPSTVWRNKILKTPAISDSWSFMFKMSQYIGLPKSNSVRLLIYQEGSKGESTKYSKTCDDLRTIRKPIMNL